MVFSYIKLSVFERSERSTWILIQTIRLLRVLWFVKISIKCGRLVALGVRQQLSPWVARLTHNVEVVGSIKGTRFFFRILQLLHAIHKQYSVAFWCSYAIKMCYIGWNSVCGGSDYISSLLRDVITARSLGNCWTILSIARRIRIVNKLDTRMRSRHTQHGGFFLKNVIGSTFFIIFVLSLISSTK